MAILSSALQTLSEMALMETSIDIPRETSSDICQMLVEDLGQMEYLTEEEMRFDVHMIPIRASKRLGKYLIEMEDLSRFMMTNGISSVKDAIGYILEANNIQGQYHNIGLIIDEDSILNEIESLGYNVTTDCWKATPKPGLGMPLIGKDHRDFQYFRDIANTKQLMDLLTGRYGLPLIKKSYKQIGLLGMLNNPNLHSEENGENLIGDLDETNETVEPKTNINDRVLNELDRDNNNKQQSQPSNITSPRRNLGSGGSSVTPINKVGGQQQPLNTVGGQQQSPNTVGGQQPFNKRPPKKLPFKESFQERMNDREVYIQKLRDIAAGKYYNEFE